MWKSLEARGIKTVVPAIGRNDFPRRREPMLRWQASFRMLSIGTRLRGYDGLCACGFREGFHT